MQIRSINGRLLHEDDAETLAESVSTAVKAGVCLAGADLRRVIVTHADLQLAIMRGADLTDAILKGADLKGVDLTDAILKGAFLKGVDLTGARLTGAVPEVQPRDDSAPIVPGDHVRSVDPHDARYGVMTVDSVGTRGCICTWGVGRGAFLISDLVRAGETEDAR